MEEKIIIAKTKGYNVLKGALDGDIKYKTIIRAKHTITDEDLGKIIDDYDYYIYEKDRMFHRCNKDGKIGAKYQDRFLNYKVLEKDFEFYKVLEEEKEIPEKLDYFKSEEQLYNMSKIILFNDIVGKINEIIDYLDYLKNKGDE